MLFWCQTDFNWFKLFTILFVFTLSCIGTKTVRRLFFSVCFVFMSAEWSSACLELCTKLKTGWVNATLHEVAVWSFRGVFFFSTYWLSWKNNVLSGLWWVERWTCTEPTWILELNGNPWGLLDSVYLQIKFVTHICFPANTLRLLFNRQGYNWCEVISVCCYRSSKHRKMCFS